MSKMLTAAKKVTIITEAIIEEQVISLLNAHNVKGYTIYRDLAGKGARGIRSGRGTIKKFGENVCIETIVSSEERARTITEAVYTKFLAEKYAGVIYVKDVQVVRPEKF
jgi:nitrogen regulatory protein PII